MGKFYETVPEAYQDWIREQKVFWVATAPLSSAGHVNVSPKGGPYFGVIDESTFWYMDLTGSGNETISHLYEPGNGRITIMFNAFEGPPRIVRLFGRGRALENGTAAFAEFVEKHAVKTIPGSRAIIIVDIHQVASSCGYSVPYFDFKDYRHTLNEFFAKKAERYEQGKEDDKLERYWAFKNAWSIDGLPGLDAGVKTASKEHIAPLEKMVGPHAPKRYRNDRRFSINHLLLVAILTAFLSPLWNVLISLAFPGLVSSIPDLRPLAHKVLG